MKNIFNKNTAKWLLFAWFALTVPSLFFLIVIGGFLPLLGIAGVTFLSTSAAFDWFIFFIVSAPQLIIYSVAYYWAARKITNALWKLTPQYRGRIYIAIIGVCGAIALIPMYGMSGGGLSPTGSVSNTKTTNVYVLYWKFIEEKIDYFNSVKNLSVGISTQPNKPVKVLDICLGTRPLLVSTREITSYGDGPTHVFNGRNVLISQEIFISWVDMESSKWYTSHITFPKDITARAKKLPALIEFGSRMTRNSVDVIYLYFDLTPDGIVTTWLSNSNSIDIANPRSVFEKISETQAIIDTRKPRLLSCVDDGLSDLIKS